ncbi:MAG: glycosyltransferase [Chthoniobacterales bacterium]|nr:glycosyltransferase [Chthoniobacterales bacterium]
MKRVLHVIDHLSLGGAQAVLFDLVTLADSNKWHIEVAVLHGRGLFAEALEKKNITVHSLAPSVWPPLYIPAFMRLQRQFDLFHFHLSGANCIAKPLAAFMGNQPRIFHDHASGNLQFRGMSSMLMDAIVNRFSSHTIAVAPEVKNFLVNYEAFSPDDITVIPNGVNTTLFRPCTPLEKKEARDFFGLHETDFLIGTVGRLAAVKNQKLFLKAAQKAIQSGLKAVFLLAGSGPEEQMLRQFATELGITDHVKFLGQVEERALFYRALDRFALTSLHEGLPIVLLEAMASGIPVISTDLEVACHVLEQGKHGILVLSDNVEAMTAAFLKAPPQHQAISARAKVEADFSAIRAAERVTEVYERLLLDPFNVSAEAV